VHVERLLPAPAVRPIWSSASVLVYSGGFVALLATVVLLGASSESWGEWALVGTALVAAGVALALAFALAGAGRAVAAGVAALLAVVFAAVVVGAALDAVGVLDASVGDYQPASLAVEAALVAGALLALARFRAPLLVLPIALTVWFALADLASLGSWDDGAAWLSVLAGALLVAAGIAVDRTGRRPYAFWLHVVGGIALGGGIAVLVGDGAWLLVALVALAFVGAGFALDRSGHTVLGALGILLATTLFAVDPVALVGGFVPFAPVVESGAPLEAWEVALSYLVAGLLLAGIGVAAASLDERRGRTPEPG
jgi:hypothetical protein